MNKPNYKNGSIVNLMASIKQAYGGKSSYKPLSGLDIKGFAKNIVLIVIDGLGYEYLIKYGSGSFLYKNLKGKMTSVFPATTAAALTAYSTGLAPQQHALTGWFMYLKEIGALVTSLRFSTRAGALRLSQGRIKYQDIYKEKSFFEGLPADSTSIKDKAYIDSEYSRATDQGAKQLPFSNLEGFFRQINKALHKKGSKTEKRKYVFVYWAKFDSLCHKYGADSPAAKKHFNELDKKIQLLAESLKNTTIIVSADHGLIDTKERHKIIELSRHPRFVDTLALPLAGEPRVVYCYVRPQKIKQFESYVKTKFKKCCEMYKSADLIKKNYFGLFKPHPKLKDRVGDYVLIMKENYIMKDFVLSEIRDIKIGNHGGLSKEEMFIPLIIIG